MSKGSVMHTNTESQPTENTRENPRQWVDLSLVLMVVVVMAAAWNGDGQTRSVEQLADTARTALAGHVQPSTSGISPSQLQPIRMSVAAPVR